jgi:hypothetical protein
MECANTLDDKECFDEALNIMLTMNRNFFNGRHVLSLCFEFKCPWELSYVKELHECVEMLRAFGTNENMALHHLQCEDFRL